MLKRRPLPEIDLARFAPLSSDLKRSALERHKTGRPQFTYNPVRQALPDLINVQPGLFAPVSPTPWKHIDSGLIRKCKTEDELKSNRQVARTLYQYADKESFSAIERDIFPITLGGVRVEYWLQYLIYNNGNFLIPFIDPRRSKGLTREGRRFAFSVMHERIRALEPDLAEAQFVVFQFDKSEQRNLRIFLDSDVELFNFDQLDQMVKETYQIWDEVLEEREFDNRRRAGGNGPLGI